MSISIDQLYNFFLKYPLISTDSRDVKPESIFFSLKGENFNGNKFAAEALSKGAAMAVVNEKKYCKDERYILVDNSLKSLQELAKYHRENLNIPVIGITGTNGKTTTKELLNSVLQNNYKTVSTFGNFNNHIGVPLTILTCTQDTEIAIIEMGANHPGEIAELCEIAKPDFGIITNIGKAHIEGFGSYKNIVNTKKALYDYIADKKGTVFVNIDNSQLLKLSENIDRVLYGTNSSKLITPDSTISNQILCLGEMLENNPFINIKLYSKSKNDIIHHVPFSLYEPVYKLYPLPYTLRYIPYILQTKFIGDYNFENILAAACIGFYFGISLDEIKVSIENFIPGSYRSQFIETAKNKIIMDAYNANPTSMVAAINNFAALKFDNKVAILGDMFELGKDSFAEHKKIVNLLILQNFENAILIGPEFTSAVKALQLKFNIQTLNFKLFISSDEAADYFKSTPLLAKTILIKGSRGIKLEKIVDTL